FEHSIDDHFGQVGIMEDLRPRGQRLVGGKDDRSIVQMPLIDHLEEGVGGVEGIGEVAKLINHQDVRGNVGSQGLTEPSLARSVGEFLDEIIRLPKEGGAAVLDGLIGNGDGEVRLAHSRGSAEDEITTFSDELRSKVGAQERDLYRGLEGEVKVLDGGEEGEV